MGGPIEELFERLNHTDTE